MALFLILILSLPIFIFLIIQIRRRATDSTTSVRLLPGPRGLPLIGNLHQLDHSKPHYYFFELSKQFGPLTSLRLGFVPTLVVSSAKMAKELSYNGLDLAFAPFNDYYRDMRKLCVVHLFNTNRAQQYCPIRKDEVSRMIKKISKSAAGVATKPVNLSELMMSLTSTIICRIGFGKRYEDEGVERSRFHALLNETEAMFGIFFFSDYFPFMGWVDKLIGLISRLEKNFKEFDAFYQKLINEHLDPKRPKSDQEDIIDVLLEIKKQRGFKIDLTWDHIKGILMVII
ncbi:hypothetical protein ACOSP7_011092 [Xanthoceras sorbifolium]